MNQVLIQGLWLSLTFSEVKGLLMVRKQDCTCHMLKMNRLILTVLNDGSYEILLVSPKTDLFLPSYDFGYQEFLGLEYP
jgi:hypothetical protein